MPMNNKAPIPWLWNIAGKPITVNALNVVAKSEKNLKPDMWNYPIEPFSFHRPKSLNFSAVNHSLHPQALQDPGAPSGLIFSNYFQRLDQQGGNPMHSNTGLTLRTRSSSLGEGRGKPRTPRFYPLNETSYQTRALVTINFLTIGKTYKLISVPSAIPTQIKT